MRFCGSCNDRPSLTRSGASGRCSARQGAQRAEARRAGGGLSVELAQARILPAYLLSIRARALTERVVWVRCVCAVCVAWSVSVQAKDMAFTDMCVARRLSWCIVRLLQVVRSIETREQKWSTF